MDPRRSGLLVLSAAAISSGWGVFVWSVNNGRNIEASLGYFITPLLNMAAGALLFRERIDRFGALAIALAAIGVALQTLALGHPPLIALFLAFDLLGLRPDPPPDRRRGPDGAVRRMPADDPAGPGRRDPCLHGAGGDIFGRAVGPSLLMMAAGPVTVAPLALFAWTARRLPLSTFGFLQFICPTIGFLIGVCCRRASAAAGRHLLRLHLGRRGGVRRRRRARGHAPSKSCVNGVDQASGRSDRRSAPPTGGS